MNRFSPDIPAEPSAMLDQLLRAALYRISRLGGVPECYQAAAREVMEASPDLALLPSDYVIQQAYAAAKSIGIEPTDREILRAAQAWVLSMSFWCCDLMNGSLFHSSVN
jgi:hypothetical protein